KNLMLWVRSDSGYLIGDQDRVEDQGGGRGVLRTTMGWDHRCRQQLYRSVSFNPAERAEMPQSMFRTIRLPLADRPGLAWDGERVRSARDCLLALDVPRDETKERPVETELILVPHAAPVAADQ
ncbi:MAG: hypothetical protein J0G36_22125, partial [Afipia sp.]|nr:hypothetical protein [Afipia sp.]